MIFLHIKHQLEYQVIGVGRDVKFPDNKVVMYRQLHLSRLRRDGKETDIWLPHGTVWTRDLSDFRDKFKHVLKA